MRSVRIACQGKARPIICAIHQHRNAVWRYEDLLHQGRTRYEATAERSSSLAYQRWVRHRWYVRRLKWRARYQAATAIPAGILSGLLCIHPKESIDWHRNGGMGPEVSGGLQIALTTWEANGGTRFAPAAYLASPHDQLVVGAHIVETSGWGPWPNTSVACGL